MKTWLIAGTLLALGVGGVAVAQTPPAPPPPGGPAGMEGPGGGPDGGPHGMRGRWMEMMHGRHHPPPPMSKAAFFRFRKGAASVGIKCADDEPTKACVDAASQLLDKLNQTR